MPGKPAATLGSMHICPLCNGTVPHVGGPVTGPGAPNVLINGKPAAIMGDMCTCTGPPDTIVQGNPSVLVNGTPIATLGAMTAHGGSITLGEANVMISTAQPKQMKTMPLKEIPFPKVRKVDSVGAKLAGKSKDHKQALENQDQIRQEAEDDDKFTVSDLKWMLDEKEISSAKIMDTVNICAKVEGIEDENFIFFKIFEKDENNEDDFITSVSGMVKAGKVEIPWEVCYIDDTDDIESAEEMQNKKYTLPEFVIKYTNSDGETIESKLLEISDELEIKAFDQETNEPLAHYDYAICMPDGTFKEGTLDENGFASVEGLRTSDNYPIVISKDNQVITIARE
ncbi:MAG: PAAR domain-containing protein [Bacteroidales bacterium]|nr:PAAR domain-containing protein [Bacteroidales bacterium]